MSVVPAHLKPPSAQYRVTRSENAASDSDATDTNASERVDDATDVYGIPKVAVVVSTKQAITQAYTDIIDELAIIDELSLSRQRKSSYGESSETDFDPPKLQSTRQAKSSAAQAAVVQPPVKKVRRKKASAGKSVASDTPVEKTAVSKPSVATAKDEETLVDNPVTPQVDYTEATTRTAPDTPAPDPVVTEKPVAKSDADRTGIITTSRDQLELSRDRRMKIERDHFKQLHPQACEARLSPTRPSTGLLDLSANDAPDDLSRPFTTLQKHYESRRKHSSSWSPDPRSFCRTYQRLLPSGWASRIVECNVKTDTGDAIPGAPHTVLFVWRDGSQGLWIVDQRATHLSGLAVEAEYTNWEVTPVHFATLIKPNKSIAWPGLRRVFKK